MSKAVFKFNSGIGALLYSKCRTIIRDGSNFSEEDWKALRGEIKMPAQYCDKCEEKLIYNDDNSISKRVNKKHRRE